MQPGNNGVLFAIANEQGWDVCTHMANRRHLVVDILVCLGIGREAVKQNAQAGARVIWDFIIRWAISDLACLVCDDVIRPLIPKADKIGRWNVTEAAGYAGANTFETGSRAAVVEIF